MFPLPPSPLIALHRRSVPCGSRWSSAFFGLVWKGLDVLPRVETAVKLKWRSRMPEVLSLSYSKTTGVGGQAPLKNLVTQLVPTKDSEHTTFQVSAWNIWAPIPPSSVSENQNAVAPTRKDPVWSRGAITDHPSTPSGESWSCRGLVSGVPTRPHVSTVYVTENPVQYVSVNS